MVESFAYRSGELDVLYRTRDADSAALLAELRELARQRGFGLHLLAGRRSGVAGADPLGPAAIRRLVPDAAERDVFLCGPDRLIERATRSLHTLGIPRERMHLEAFG
jgi:ferredoxin-NADP reductase